MVEQLRPLPALTKRQGDVLVVIANHILRHGFSPSLGDIRNELSVGENTNLTPYLQPLYAKGYLKTVPRYSRRSFELTPEAMPVLHFLLRERGQMSPEVFAAVGY